MNQIIIVIIIIMTISPSTTTNKAGLFHHLYTKHYDPLSDINDMSNNTSSTGTIQGCVYFDIDIPRLTHIYSYHYS
eukprot:UN08825